MMQPQIIGTRITIPAGGIAQFTQQGYCMDAGLPAPQAGEKLRLLPIARLIPNELVPLYKGLRQLALQDVLVSASLQLLVWGLREAGTKGVHANVLIGSMYLSMMSRALPGGDRIFLQYHRQGLARDRVTEMVNNLAKVNIGGRQYGVADFATPDKANSLVGQTMSEILRRPVEGAIPSDDSDYSMPLPGVAAQVVGVGPLTPTISLANTNAAPITFDLTDFFAESRRKVQRVALAIPSKISVSDKKGDSVKELADQFLKDLVTFMRDKSIEGMTPNKINALIQKRSLSALAPILGANLLKVTPGIGQSMQLFSALEGKDMLTDEPMGCAQQALSIIGTLPGARAYAKIAGSALPTAVKALSNAAVTEKIISAIERSTLQRDVLSWVTSDTAGMLYTQVLPDSRLTDRFINTLTKGCDGGIVGLIAS